MLLLFHPIYADPAAIAKLLLRFASIFWNGSTYHHPLLPRRSGSAWFINPAFFVSRSLYLGVRRGFLPPSSAVPSVSFFKLQQDVIPSFRPYTNAFPVVCGPSPVTPFFCSVYISFLPSAKGVWSNTSLPPSAMRYSNNLSLFCSLPAATFDFCCPTRLFAPLIILDTFRCLPELIPSPTPPPPYSFVDPTRHAFVFPLQKNQPLNPSFPFHRYYWFIVGFFWANYHFPPKAYTEDPHFPWLLRGSY